VIGDILQPTHLLFILVVALLVLGPKRLPEVGRSLGRGLRDFRNALSGDDHDEVVARASTPTEDAAPPAPTVQVAAEPAPEPVERLG
jgi:sec-independent protein translocase protein TatA